MPFLDDMNRVAARTCWAIWPSQLPNGRVALFVAHKMLDLNDWLREHYSFSCFGPRSAILPPLPSFWRPVFRDPPGGCHEIRRGSVGAHANRGLRGSFLTGCLKFEGHPESSTPLSPEAPVPSLAKREVDMRRAGRGRHSCRAERWALLTRPSSAPHAVRDGSKRPLNSPSDFPFRAFHGVFATGLAG